MFSFRIAPELEAIGESRLVIRDALNGWGVDRTLADIVVLLASELVTNALVHARPPIELMIDWKDPHLRVGVSDGEDRMPEMVEPPRRADGGYGLHVIEQLSREWGAARRVGGGKIVWFELERRRQT